VEEEAMNWKLTMLSGLALAASASLGAEPALEAGPDTFGQGDQALTIHFLGHASLWLESGGVNVYVDPVSAYLKDPHLPKADYILLTHEHGDHLDAGALERLSGPSTVLITNASSARILGRGRVLANGEAGTFGPLQVRAVPAYNTTPGREKFHPQGRDNGYLVVWAGRTLYLAGDTEDIPEMGHLGPVDIAFLPANQPYTMTPTQLARAAALVRPQVLYPYHFGDTSVDAMAAALQGLGGVEVRFRSLR